MMQCVFDIEWCCSDQNASLCICFNQHFSWKKRKGLWVLRWRKNWLYCITSTGLGYHNDVQTRAAFIEVLTKILQQGTEFDTLAETVLADRFERLVGLVTMLGDKGELPIAMALANVVASSQMVSYMNHTGLPK